MEQNSSINTIELQGIVRNTTKLAQQDGQTDELINLRLKDGSWQPTGEGKQVFTLPVGWEFNQMYIHTNVYRHLLGVSNSTLYWIANIDADGVFYTGDSSEPDNENKTAAVALFRSSGEYQPIEICRVQGKVDIMQTGHLITIIDESERFDYFVFKRDDYAGTQEYRKVVVDVNDDSSNRELYPFGRVSFNYYSPQDFEIIDSNLAGDYLINLPYRIDPTKDAIEENWNNIITGYSDAEKKNLFTKPFCVVAAIKLYDNTYLYATNPIIIYPRQIAADSNYVLARDDKNHKVSYIKDEERLFWIRAFHSNNTISGGKSRIVYQSMGNYLASVIIDVSDYYDRQPDYFPSLTFLNGGVGAFRSILLCNKLLVKVKNSFINDNKDIFKSFCIFITPEIQNYRLDWEDRTNIPERPATEYYTYMQRKKEDIIYDLLHQHFYLLREYENIDELISNPIIDLSKPEYDGLLKSINEGTATEQLTYEAINRQSYLPKVSYLYNGRVHIANYTAYQFKGYPLESFLYHNMAHDENNNLSVHSPLLDYPRTQYPFVGGISLTADEQQTIDTMRNTNKPFAYIKTTIETDSGMQIVVRYIPAYDPTTSENGRIDVIESLNPLVCFPDSRAKEMEIYVANVQSGGSVKVYRKTFELKAHPYLNLAYYISPDLMPIDLDFEYEYQDLSELDNVPYEVNASEYVPNGMKVSKVNNPMYFPVESTYQVGSSEIVALASNAKAVGTGQTGQAPLYTFTKDGVYGLFVDSSGQVAYNTARILTRDVCNNAKSVTPIDAGVAFTTDRGLMLMQGEEAKELSQPAEGEPNKFCDTSDAVEYCKIAANALQLDQLAGLANQQTQEDLLDFLKGCIINYNHNERELMISNPDKSYTYILDRDGNWSKRDYTADEYVNNFPTSYRVKDGVFYKVDEESNADNGVYILTRPLKLGTIAYKQAFRCVVRGVFELLDDTKALGLYMFGSYDGRKWSLLGGNEKRGGMFTDIGCKVERTDVKFYRLCLAGQLKQNSRLDFIEITAEAKLHDKLR